MKPIWSITRKELGAYFGSPTALIFLGIFLVVTLFTFFWVAGFFARGLADIRPLFQWMPLLLIFLVAALTMRQWSEEQRTGTVEVLMTLPVTQWQLVLGKFLAVMILVTIALALTLPVPLMVGLLGPLDWGPVLGGYLAALLMAAAYTAIGLFMSALTDNQIVALLLTGVVGGLIYLAGAPVMVNLVGEPWATLLNGIGSGSRFASVERGVIDLRDLVYYLSVALFFLSATVFTLDARRWSHGARTAAHRRNSIVGLVLVGANLLVLNLWLAPLWNLRLDATAQKEYTLSATTKELLGTLQEPLLIRAYISEQTHPLLDPLRPQVEDLLREYAIAGNGNVTAEVVDPATNPELEAEANQTYGIQPTPFQVADRYQAAVVNAYFDILVRYGDQNTVLSFRDLIQVEPQADGGLDVSLRNLEYDVTSAVKKAVYGFQNIETVLGAQSEPANVTLYVTPNLLPPELTAAPAAVQAVVDDINTKSGGKLAFTQVDPTAPDSGATADQLWQQYGIQPIPLSLFGTDGFYLHLVVNNGGQAQVIYPQADMSEGAVREALQSAVLRTAAGFLKVVGLWTPPATPTQNAFGQMQQPLQSYNYLRDQLSQAYTVRDVDLTSGQPPTGIDTLLLVAPQQLSDKERFAIDQYLMRGGAVIALAGNYQATPDEFTGQLNLAPVAAGLGDMLRHYGIDVQNSLVMDMQNQPFPVQTVRDAGGFQVQEIQALNYPFFVDVRSDGMDQEQGIAGGLPNVTLNWASPVTVDAARTATATVSTLLRSTANAWLRTDTNIQPDFNLYPDMGFPVEGALSQQPLGVAIQGSLPSYFAGKPNPLVETDATGAMTSTTPVAQIDQSPATARLAVIGSSEFVNDFILQLSSSLVGQQVLNNVQYVQNAVDWAVEDTELLGLRTRGAFTRLLDPLDDAGRQRWEWLTYAVVVAGLLLVGGLAYSWRRSEKPMKLAPRNEFKDMAEIG